MKVLAAYLLAVLRGNTAPSAEDLKDILRSVGAKANGGGIQLPSSGVERKDIAKLIASGQEKMASVPSTGGSAFAYAVAVASTGGGAAPALSEAKKEEKSEENEES
ncbi:60S acidic ribosomal protein P2-2-like, partial [Pyrus x bretschneideri]|uniref:60S acidic ribosomal protein P2-2-like n=1 Tax=Pyrus x bretschneideri TaxID=225117 RepID=UPI00203061BD